MKEITPKNRRVNFGRLPAFGFCEEARGYVYKTAIGERGMMEFCALISPEGRLYTEVTDPTCGEEYTLHLVSSASGTFVCGVKAEYDALLARILAECFDAEVFRLDQTKQLLAHAKDAYGSEPEYLWQKFPDNAVLRRGDNKKWYAALLTVSKRKLGLDSDERVEILDLRATPEDIPTLVNHTTCFPGYHMNKKHWITLCLDGSLPIEEIFARLAESYRLAEK